MKQAKTLKIGGFERPIRFSFSTILGVELATGRTIADVASSQKLDDIVTILHQGLISGANKENKKIDFKRQDVINWLDDEDDISKVVEAISSLMTDSLPNAEEGAEASNENFSLTPTE
jgi:hypothetical protein